MENSEREEALDRLVNEQQSLRKLIHQTNTMVRNSVGLSESIQGYTEQISTHTIKVEKTLEMASRAMQVLQKLTEGEAKFTDTLQQFRQDSKDKSEAFKKFVEYLLAHKDGYDRLTERLSQGMKTLDDDTRRYLVRRKEQLDAFYEVSMQQLSELMEAEKRLFQEAVSQLRPEGLHKALAQLDLLTSIHEHVSQLELSEEGLGFLAGMDKQVQKLEKSNSAIFFLLDKHLKTTDQASKEDKLLLQSIIQEMKNLRYIALLGCLMLIVLCYLFFIA